MYAAIGQNLVDMSRHRCASHSSMLNVTTELFRRSNSEMGVAILSTINIAVIYSADNVSGNIPRIVGLETSTTAAYDLCAG